MIIGISGVAIDAHGNKATTGVGKDEVAKHLEDKHYGQGVALADPLKRIARQVYDFSVKQLWGPSQYRNEMDVRYPRPEHVLREARNGIRSCACCLQEWELGKNAPVCYLTPRYALQLLGTEWGRHCYPDTWVTLALRIAGVILDGRATYSRVNGLDYDGPLPTIRTAPIPDMRFKNEFNAVRGTGGRNVRVVRHVDYAITPSTHQSEIDLMDVPDEKFDYVLNNDGDLNWLYTNVDRMMSTLSGSLRPYSESQEDVPPFKRV